MGPMTSGGNATFRMTTHSWMFWQPVSMEMVLLHLPRGITGLLELLGQICGVRSSSQAETDSPCAEFAGDRRKISQQEACQRHQRRHQQDIGHGDHPQHAFDGHGWQDGHHDAGDDQDAEARLWTGQTSAFRAWTPDSSCATLSLLTFFTSGEYLGV